MALPAANSYDALPYHSNPLSYTHPDRLATIATVFGMTPPDVQTARILELGCANGRNLMAIATSLPNAHCVGVDLSARQIEEGQAKVQQLGLSNVQLSQQDLAEFTAEAGSFDYIIAHGLYSWVPAPMRDRVLAICQNALSENGVAYISYNTRPGWNVRGSLRELMQYHTQHLNDPSERAQALRKILQLLAEASEAGKDAYSQMLQQELKTFRSLPESYLFHEFLETDNHPVYFHEFVEHAQQHELSYLGDVYFHTMLPSNLGGNAAEAVQKMARDVVFQEQHLDFLRNRHFRHTLLCHQGVKLNRSITPEVMKGMSVASPLVPDKENAAKFNSEHGVIETPSTLIQAAFKVLFEQWPRAIAFDDLLAQAQQSCGATQAEDADSLAAILLRCYSAGIIESHVTPSPFTVAVGEKPMAPALARLEASNGRQVTNLRCELVNVENVMALRLLPHLDGQNTVADLLALAQDWLKTNEIQLNFQAQDGNTQKTVQLNPKQEAALLNSLLQEALRLIAKGALLV